MFRASFMKNVPLFIRNFSENVILCLVAAGVETTSTAITKKICLHWRERLTSSIHNTYFQNMVGLPQSCCVQTDLPRPCAEAASFEVPCLPSALLQLKFNRQGANRPACMGAAASCALWEAHAASSSRG